MKKRLFLPSLILILVVFFIQLTSSFEIINLQKNVTTASITDTNASTECSGDEVLLGNGSCQTSSAFGTPVTDTNESVRFEELIAGDCGAGTFAIGVESNGSLLCLAETISNETDLISTVNTTTNIFALINNTLGWTLNFSKIFSKDWSNVTITESQVTDLSHTTDTNASTECSNGEYLDGDTACYNFNSSVSLLLKTTYYNATQAEAVVGTIDGGILDDTQHPNGNYDGVSFNFSEEAGSPGLDLRMNFTGVDDFNGGVIRYKTSSILGDEPVIQLWDYADSDWESYPTLSESTNFVIIAQQVYDSADHLSGGVVQMRLYKSANGNINNKYYIDWVAITDGAATPAGEEVDPLSIHKDGDVALTGDWDFGDYNINGSGNISADFFFANNWTNVTIEEWQVTDLSHTVDTNESARVEALQDGNCSVGDFIFDIHPNGTFECRTPSYIADTNESDRVETLWNNETYSYVSNETDLVGTVNTTTNIFSLINNTIGWIMNFSKIYSKDWSNVTITESQITDLAHDGTGGWTNTTDDTNTSLAVNINTNNMTIRDGVIVIDKFNTGLPDSISPSSALAIQNNETGSAIQIQANSTKISQIFLGDSFSVSAGKIAYANAQDRMRFGVADTNELDLISTSLYPVSDRGLSLGTISNRWNGIWATLDFIRPDPSDSTTGITYTNSSGGIYAMDIKGVTASVKFLDTDSDPVIMNFTEGILTFCIKGGSPCPTP